MSKLSNQNGSALVYSLVGVSLLIGLSMFMMEKGQGTKEQEAELTKIQYMRLFKKKVATMFSDPETCRVNLENVSLEQTLNVIKDSKGNPIYQSGKYYFGSAVLFNGMVTKTHTTDPADHFVLSINASRNHGKKVARQDQIIQLNMAATFDTGKIKTCQLEADGGSSVNDAIADLCQGPGMFSNTDGKCIIKDPHPGLARNCNFGEAISGISLVGQQLVSTCSKIITQPGVCDFGVKYTGVAGKFTCLTLFEIVNPATSTVSVGSSCQTDLVNGQFTLKCTSPSCTDPVGQACPNVDPATICDGETAPAANDSCNRPCPVVTGTKSCPTCQASCFTAGFDCRWGSNLPGTTPVTICGSGVTHHCGPDGLSGTEVKMCLAPAP